MHTQQFSLRRSLRAAALLGAIAAGFGLSGCADAGGPLDVTKTYQQPTTVQVEEPIKFCQQDGKICDPDAYKPGDMSIADLTALVDSSAYVWYGFSPDDPYPMGDTSGFPADCDPSSYTNAINKIDQLPTYIEGVVTLQPHYLQKVSLCGESQRFYGSYFIQDKTGGILILKDSRVADFTYGNRVKLRVRALVKAFDTVAVLVHDDEQVDDPDTQHDIYWKSVTDREFDSTDNGKVRRVTGTIVTEPTNANFNQMDLKSDDGSKTWSVSLDRQLGLRGLTLDKGMRIQVTGPVVVSYGTPEILVGSVGQIKWLDDGSQ